MLDEVLPPPLGSVSQVAYVVEDLDRALEYWIKVMDAGPFFVFEHPRLENQRYRGQPSTAEIALAVGNSGDTQIELIVCKNDAPSIYREFLDAGRVGVHHVGLMPPDYDAAQARYRALGIEIAFECAIAGTHLIYYDTVAELGHFTEIWEKSPSFLEFQRSVRAAARHWDGRDPIRSGAL